MDDTPATRRRPPIRRAKPGADSQVVRALALLVAMSRSRRGVVLKAFAEERGYPLRNVYRARDVLLKAGAPLAANPKHPGHWQLADGWLPASVVGAARSELLSLFVARHLAPGLRGTFVGRSLESLWSRLTSSGSQQSLALEAGPSSIAVRPHATIDYGKHAAVIDELAASIRDQHAVWIRYRTPQGEVTDRVIEPGYLHWDGGLEAMYVPSWCRLRGAMRVFAVHRILAVESLPTSAVASVPRRGVLEHAFRVWYRDQLEVVELRFSSAVAGEIRERTWHPSQRLVEDGGGEVALHLRIGAPDELERWLLGFGAEVRVISPVGLAERIRAVHVRAAGRSVLSTAIARPLRASERASAISRGPRTRQATRR